VSKKLSKVKRGKSLGGEPSEEEDLVQLLPSRQSPQNSGHVPPLDGDAEALQEEASGTLLSRDLSDPPPNLLNQLEGLLGLCVDYRSQSN